jgi:hypothetical protein
MYKCMYPDCTYTVHDRNLIDWHHIKPKEIGGSDAARNRLFLCPTHHRMIYVPEVSYGIHSIKSRGSIIVKGFMNSTAGIVLHFVDCDDDIDYFYMYSKNLKAPAV